MEFIPKYLRARNSAPPLISPHERGEMKRRQGAMKITLPKVKCLEIEEQSDENDRAD